MDLGKELSSRVTAAKPYISSAIPVTQILLLISSSFTLTIVLKNASMEEKQIITKQEVQLLRRDCQSNMSKYTIMSLYRRNGMQLLE